METCVRPARGGDVGAIIALLRSGFGPHWSPEKWRRLFEYPRVQSQPNLGFVLESGDRLVGFLGAVYSERFVGARLERFCNLSSWYTIPQFRNSSLKLLVALLDQPGYTFINLTPSEGVVPMMKMLEFRLLESHKLLYGPSSYVSLLQKKSEILPRTFPFYQARRVLEVLIETPLLKGLELMRASSPARSDLRGVRLLASAELVRPVLSTLDQQLLDDHPQCGHFVVQDGRSYSHIITVKRKIGFRRWSPVDFVVSEILHLSSPGLASRDWRGLCQFIAAHDDSQAIMADSRLLDSKCLLGLQIPYNSYFMTRSGVTPDQIDGLYTEITLLDGVLDISPSPTNTKRPAA